MKIDVKKFEEEGYAGPFRLFGEEEAEALLPQMYFPKKLFTWYKGYHEKSLPVGRTAALPGIVDVLKPLLGNDILLWGSVFIGQKPSQNHDWHLDVEHAEWEGVTLWLALKNLNEKTSVSVITRSHKLGFYPQELRKNHGIDVSNDAAVLAEARKHDPKCELKTFHLKPGEFILWNGKAWHATLNKSDKTRYTMVLQYCTPDNKVRIPTNYEYPGTTWSDIPPTCLLISGEDKFHKNKILRKEDVEAVGKILEPFYSMAFKGRQFLERVMR